MRLAAVVMTLRAVPRPSQIRWCLLPVFRRSTGDGPVSAPLFSRGCENRPHTHATSRVRRPRSARRAGSDATGRRPQPPATAPAGASTSAPSRTPVPAAAVARLCRCTGRTGCPGGRAGPTPASAPETAPATAAATARPEPTTHRPRSTVGYLHPHERPNHHTGNGLPGRFSKIVLRAIRERETGVSVVTPTPCGAHTTFGPYRWGTRKRPGNGRPPTARSGQGAHHLRSLLLGQERAREYRAPTRGGNRRAECRRSLTSVARAPRTREGGRRGREATRGDRTAHQ